MQCSFAKILSANDTAHKNNQAGPLIPKALAPFFPRLDTSQRSPRVSLRIELFDGNKSLGVAEAKYIWYASKGEYHLTNIRPIIPLWTEGDAIKFVRIGPREYHLHLVRQGSELWNEIAEGVVNLRGCQCGPLTGDISDLREFEAALESYGGKGPRKLYHKPFDAEECLRKAKERYERRKRKPSTSVVDPDKAGKRSLKHDQCVARLAKGLEKLFPACTFTQSGIDLKMQFFGESGSIITIIIIFETKTLRGDERAQLEKAVGQLAKFSSQTWDELGIEPDKGREAGYEVYKCVNTDRKPSDSWIRTLEREGIGLIWTPERSGGKRKSKAQREAEEHGATDDARKILRRISQHLNARTQVAAAR